MRNWSTFWESHLAREGLIERTLDDGPKPFVDDDVEPKYAPDHPAETKHLKVDIRVDLEKKHLEGTATLTMTGRDADVSWLSLNCVSPVVRSVTVGGKEQRFHRTDETLLIQLNPPLKPGATIDVAIDYEVENPPAGIYFVHPDQDYPDKATQMWSQNQDEDARFWIPTPDSPNHRISTEFVVTTDRKYTVISNGKLMSEKENGDQKTTHWLQEKPHATYLMTLVIGEFARTEQSYNGKTVDWFVDSRRKEEGDRAFGRTVDMIRIFSEKIGVDYPWDKYTQVAVQDFIFGGMENTSATTQTDMVLLDERAALDFTADTLVSHELAHQWFGDLLTCKSWSHGWLNEGFATYFESMWKEFDLGRDEFDYYMLGVAENYFMEDASSYRRPIVTNKYEEPIDLFDRHLYEKGGMVLHTLRHKLGDDRWWRFVKQYVTDNEYGVVETVDLQRSLERLTGTNLESFLDQWVFRGGYPSLEASYSYDHEAKQIQIRVKQSQTISKDEPAFQLQIPVFLQTNGQTIEKNLAMTRSEQTFTLPADAAPDRVEVDPGFTFLRKLELQFPVAMLEKVMTESSHVMGRIEAARSLMDKAEPRVGRMLISAYDREAFWGVRAQIAKLLGKLGNSEARDALIARLKSESHPKARRAVAAALGTFTADDAAFQALKTAAEKDASYFVEAQAATSLGNLHHKESQKTLTDLLPGKSTWNNTVERGIIDGLASVGDDQTEDALKTVLPLLKRGQSTLVRSNAIRAVGKLGKDKSQALDALIGCLNDPDFRVKVNAIGALRTLGDRKAISELDKMASHAADGRIKRMARQAAQSLRKGDGLPDDVRNQVDDLERTTRRLRERLDKLESQSADPIQVV